MKISDFDYDLPPTLIAQTPIEPRDASRLLVINRIGDALLLSAWWATSFVIFFRIKWWSHARVAQLGARADFGPPLC